MSEDKGAQGTKWNIFICSAIVKKRRQDLAEKCLGYLHVSNKQERLPKGSQTPESVELKYGPALVNSGLQQGSTARYMKIHSLCPSASSPVSWGI